MSYLSKEEIAKLVKTGAMRYPSEDAPTIPRVFKEEPKSAPPDMVEQTKETLAKARLMLLSDWCEQNSNPLRLVINRRLESIERAIEVIAAEYAGKNELVLSRAVERTLTVIASHKMP